MYEPLLDLSDLAGNEAEMELRIEEAIALHRRFYVKSTNIHSARSSHRMHKGQVEVEPILVLHSQGPAYHVRLPRGWRCAKTKDDDTRVYWRAKDKDKHLVTRVAQPGNLLLYAESYLFGEEVAKPGNEAKILVNAIVWIANKKRTAKYKLELRDDTLYHWGKDEKADLSNAECFIPVLLAGLSG